MPSAKREANRAEKVERVKVVARRQLARDGASALSLREVAREMHQTSSALYRYFANRDELLTALIVDAYTDLGGAAERADETVDRGDTLGRWRAVTGAIRAWAHSNPHEYALIFGSPVPGYAAPQLTIAAATKTTLVLSSIMSDHFRLHSVVAVDGDVPEHALLWPAVSDVLQGVPREIALRAILVWSALFGFINFELFGHFVGSVDDADELFGAFVDDSAHRVGMLLGS